jgi:ATPase subunit of ABC transporter with duplicated ATPase domains
MSNSPVPAAATGLPNARRTFLRLVTGGATPFEGNVADHPDAEIFRLIEQHDANEKAFKQFRATRPSKAMTRNEVEEAEKPFHERSEGLIRQLSGLRSKTLAGLKAKAAFHETFEKEFRCELPEIQASLWRDIRAL